MKDFVLASASPRRKELLSILNMKFDVVKSDADESAVPKNLPPNTYVRELAMLKAVSAVKHLKRDMYVIGADTVVECEGEIMGKPKNPEDAARMLRLLSGQTHRVYTGICVLRSEDGFAAGTYACTEVQFRTLEAEEIEAYIASGEPFDKAGGYAVQGLASIFIEEIRGDYFNVVGLPLYKLSKLLKDEFGIDVLKG